MRNDFQEYWYILRTKGWYTTKNNVKRTELPGHMTGAYADKRRCCPRDQDARALASASGEAYAYNGSCVVTAHRQPRPWNCHIEATRVTDNKIAAVRSTRSQYSIIARSSAVIAERRSAVCR
eukprot:6204666-Pleurochrysis_carterae.AAC.2